MKKTLLSLVAISMVSGCATPSSYDARTPLTADVTQKALDRQAMTTATAPISRVTESDASYIPVTSRKVSENSWLRGIKVSVQTGKDPVPMSEVLRALSRQGIAITSELPLNKFQYSGFSLVDIDAESALRAILTSVGLDYQADASRRLVVITPMSSRTWYLNMGNRHSSYASGGNTSADPSSTNAVAKAMGSAAGGSSNQSSNSAQGGSSGSAKSEVVSSDDFWTSLRTELDSRLKLMLPDAPKQASAQPSTAPATSLPGIGLPGPGLPPVIPPMGAAQGGTSTSNNSVASAPGTTLTALTPTATASSDGLLSYTAKQVGSYALNPETGAVTVQAPHWILQDLDAYFKRITAMYNTELSFQGELIMLTSDVTKSEGLDISSFAKFAGSKYGAAYQNNALGGVTVSFPTSGSTIPSITAGPLAMSGPLLGIQNLTNGLQIFNAYLTNIGKVTTLQRPVLTTTSGVPADFRRTVTRYFNTVSQQAASGGTGNAAVSTQNILIPQDFGTVLRVNPRIDISTGLIRAQIELLQMTQTGTQTLPQLVTSGNSVQQIDSQLPIVSKILYSGEALLKDGDLIVMGGQTEDDENVTRNGITNLMDSSAVGGAFGTSNATKTRDVFYFALKVSVSKR